MRMKTLDVKSLAAAFFLSLGLYMFMRADQGTVASALVQALFLMAIALGFYLSYRLAIIVNEIS